ncbi:enoyl-CoA hydratase/isomerase family protein [Janthinobacterium fluminis]|uniref:3-hydroxyisobutyryl-CoA hydrolase n=1 Tax=Janthinobacterium fluminis TaxID=2987524 RepID=A0ABT5JVD4_9BURK|nr:enoyl-CoA hydratase/isomerase family protein [Janthinobacterium fluminis]MDC8756684.1 enoyl-CoA hydratase/isomerase family protein [Janthinobacterium fluminis]
MSAVLFETLACAGGATLGVATLNAEKTLNALSHEMIVLLHAQLAAWQADPAVALVVLQAAGDKAFCAGGDLQNLYASMRQHHASARRGDVLGNDYALRFFSDEYRLDYLIHSYAKPVLCWGHGIVMGGGIGLMAGASHRVVTEGSRLAMPEISVGLYPDVGASWFLNRMPGRLGLFLALTGAAIDASDARFVKLADYQLAHAAKAEVIAQLRRQPWSGRAGDNHALLDEVLARAQHAGEAAEPGPLRRHIDAIDAWCAGPRLAPIVARIGGIDSDERWLQKAVASLRHGCPGSAWLAHAMQERARHLSLFEVFQLELGVSLACAAGPDFAEGIRALLIEKDMRPRWQPASLAEIDAEWGERFFVQPWTAQNHPLQASANASV